MRMIIVESASAPTVEIDSAAGAAYVRFKKIGKVAKTISRLTSGPVVAVDLDKNQTVIGVELVGVKEFGISQLLKKVPFLDVKAQVPLDKTRYVSSNRARFEAEEVCV